MSGICRFPRSARQLSGAIRSGKLDPLELCEYHLERIARHNSSLAALSFINEAEARAQAKLRRNEAAKEGCLGRLHGLFYTVLDSPASAAMMQRLNTDGAICIGKTGTPGGEEYLCPGQASKSPVRNPYDTSLSAGERGAGNAAALAAEFSDFAAGIDIGGSGNVPANYCGVFGICPTQGVISCASPAISKQQAPRRFHRTSLVAYTLDDLEVIFSVLAGYNRLDPFSLAQPIETGRARKGLFAFFSKLGGVRACGEIRDALSKMVKEFESSGLRAEENTPGSFTKCVETFAATPVQTPDGENDPFGSLAGARFEVAAFFEKFDFVLCPVTAAPHPPLDAPFVSVDGSGVAFHDLFNFAVTANLLGLPSLAFPCGMGRSGAPLGLQLIGPRFSGFDLIEFLRNAGVNSAPAPALDNA